MDTPNNETDLNDEEIDYEFEKYGISTDSIAATTEQKSDAIVPVTDSDAIVQKLDAFIAEGFPVAENNGLLIVKSADQWIDDAKKKPVPDKLFGEFWFEGEICILFSDTNQGKSILAVQIGHSISRGMSIPGFELTAHAQPVLYFDFELSQKQFETRYSIDYTRHFVFGPNFYRAEINPDDEVPEGKPFEEYLNHSIEQSIISSGTKVLIIDNLTYLRNETEKANNALTLMKHLKKLKNKYELSILTLAHTPKRDLSKPITRNDLQGSKMLINFCDSSFAIGECHTDISLRYLKQIKVRNAVSTTHRDNVCLCQVNKPANFLQFEFLRYSGEEEHLKRLTGKEADERIKQATELRSQGISNIEIARRLNVSEGAVRKWFKKEEDAPF